MGTPWLKTKLFQLYEPIRARSYYSSANPTALRSRRRLQELANRHRGRRAFIIGNGPSINRQDLNLLDGEVSFACNSFFLKYDQLAFRPTYHVVEDVLVAEDNSEALSCLDCSEKLIPWDLQKLIKPDDRTTYVDFRRYYLPDSDPDFPRFRTDDSEKFYWGATVLYLCVQLAAHMGCDPIYLVGVDLSYKIPEDVLRSGGELTSTSDDPNHFHPAYFGAGKRWHIPMPERMGHCFHSAWGKLATRGIRLVNATDGGNLNSIPRESYSDLFRSG